MMKIITLILTLLTLCACSSYRGHNRTDKMLVRLKGGIYEDQKWDDTLIFKRTSFYEGAKLNHDMIITKLDKTSPFYQWMGDQKSILDNCTEVFVALFYKDMNAIRAVPISYMRDQIIKTGLQEITIQNFAYYLRQHYAFDEWILTDHKVYGYCNRSGVKTRKIHMTMPGYRRVNILK